MGTRRPLLLVNLSFFLLTQGQLMEVTFIQEVLGPSASRHVGLLAPKQKKHLSYWGDHVSGGRTDNTLLPPCGNWM